MPEINFEMVKIVFTVAFVGTILMGFAAWHIGKSEHSNHSNEPKAA